PGSHLRIRAVRGDPLRHRQRLSADVPRRPGHALLGDALRYLARALRRRHVERGAPRAHDRARGPGDGARGLPLHAAAAAVRARAMLNRAGPHSECACARCGAHLHPRKPNSVSRSWAFLVAALVCYAPANMLPVLYTGTIFEQQDQTILGGVITLWQDGSWVLALIVFVASIVVPVAKI